ncbi:MAG TPA: hypothetical protein VGS19_06775 [Streptosporangiaceae bacterium]|nr:hypothetical protein [Streptosporangiaceae bacterium]
MAEFSEARSEFDEDVEPETVAITAFNREFSDVLPGLAQALKTLEGEGAIYAEFADTDESGRFSGTFTRYRVKFNPPEIVEYVQAHIAMQEFENSYKLTGDFALPPRSVLAAKALQAMAWLGL